MFIECNECDSKTDLFIFGPVQSFSMCNYEKWSWKTWSTWREKETHKKIMPFSHCNPWIPNHTKFSNKNVLTHHWCHFLESLWRMDCWQSLIESPVIKYEKFFFTKLYADGHKLKTQYSLQTKGTQWNRMPFIKLTHSRRSDWLLFLILALIVGLNSMLDRRIESINQADACKPLRWFSLKVI